MITHPQPFISTELRAAAPANRFGLGGVDHIGLPCRDPEVAAAFVEEILGGIECCRFGYTEEDRVHARMRHIFYHVGPQLLEVAEERDAAAHPDASRKYTNPHVAFRVSPEDMAAFVQHLERAGVPFNGPRTHFGASVVSVYFCDPDGNHLEVSTWDPIPPGLLETTPAGGKFGFIPWPELAHNWRPGQRAR
jgi:catechol 2,3-dioxygenase-like lactoylglutathione lyase family enzyme